MLSMFEEHIVLITMFSLVIPGVSAVFYGNILLYRQRLEEGRSRRHGSPVAPISFFWDQAVCAVLNPMEASAIFGATVLMWPFILALTWAEASGRFFDMRQIRQMRLHDRFREEFKERYGMEWQIISDRDAQAFGRWQSQIISEDERHARAVQRLTEATTEACSFAVVAASLLLSLLAVSPKKARAGEPEGEEVEEPIAPGDEAPFVPEPVRVHGVLIGAAHWNPESGESALVLQKADLILSGAPAEKIGWFAMFSMATLTNGGTDPVTVAFATWKPAPRLDVHVGRVFVPVGFGRQPAPHKKIELTYPASGPVQPFFDNGVLAQLRPVDRLALDLGLVSGRGTGLGSGIAPDLVAHLALTPTDALTLGTSGQIGPQGSGWRRTLDAYAVLETKRFALQAEGTTNVELGDTPGISSGWWLLACAKPREEVDVYARFERRRLSQALPVANTLLIGTNIRPAPHTALRGAVEIPMGNLEATTLHAAGQIDF